MNNQKEDWYTNNQIQKIGDSVVLGLSVLMYIALFIYPARHWMLEETSIEKFQSVFQLGTAIGLAALVAGPTIDRFLSHFPKSLGFAIESLQTIMNAMQASSEKARGEGNAIEDKEMMDYFKTIVSLSTLARRWAEPSPSNPKVHFLYLAAAILFFGLLCLASFYHGATWPNWFLIASCLIVLVVVALQPMIVGTKAAYRRTAINQYITEIGRMPANEGRGYAGKMASIRDRIHIDMTRN